MGQTEHKREEDSKGSRGGKVGGVTEKKDDVKDVERQWRREEHRQVSSTTHPRLRPPPQTKDNQQYGR